MRQMFFPLLLVVLLGFGLSKAEQIQQCTCDQQGKCIGEIKQEIEACLDECEVKIDLKSALNESSTVNIGPCMEKRKKIISEFYDCVDDQCSLKESCVKGKGGEQKVESTQDFEVILLKFVRPMAEKMLKKIETIGKGLNIQFVDMAVDMNKCAQDCAFKKLPTLKCFEKEKCALKVSENVVKETLKQCQKQMDVKQKIKEVCQCFQQNGAKNLTPFCEKIGTIEIPAEF